jgi:hypothetical protein
MTTLVTAMYGYGVNSIYGGRGRHIQFYNTSLKNINNLNLPIVIYTDNDNFKIVENYISQYMQNYKIIPYELSSFEFAEPFLNYKNSILSNIDLNDRNHILCYNKAYWVKDAIKNNYFNTEKFLWIDSGLTHHGIFPEKVGGVELLANIPESQYFPFNANNIFCPSLGNKLDQTLTPGKIFSCALQLQGGDYHLKHIIKNSLNVDVVGVGDHIIGGIFGGYKDTFLDFFNKYHVVLKYCINNNIQILEEPIFSCLQAVYPELFDVHRFTTWYFYSPGERTHMCEEECDSFYKIFTRLLHNK